MVFAPPEEIQTEIVGRVPDEYRVTRHSDLWGGPVDLFIEGPSIDHDGNLLFVDIPWGRVFRMTPDGTVDLVAEYDGAPSGLKIAKDGQVYIADIKRGIIRLDRATGEVSSVVGRHREGLKGVNDLVFAENGDLYFTDQGATGLHDPTGRVLWRRAGGEIEVLIDFAPSPNGLVLNRQGTTLFLAVTRGNAIWRVPLLANGRAGTVGLFVQLSGGIGPDGMAIDSAGNIFVCHPGLGVVWAFTPMGEPLYRIRSAAGAEPTNLCFGGSDMRDLYITESATGSILRARMETPGHPMYSHL